MLRAPRRCSPRLCPSRDGDDVRECVCYQHNRAEKARTGDSQMPHSLSSSLSLFLSSLPSLPIGPSISFSFSLLFSLGDGAAGIVVEREIATRTHGADPSPCIFIAFIFPSRRRTVVYFPDASFCAASATVFPRRDRKFGSIPIARDSAFHFLSAASSWRSIRANIPLSDLYDDRIYRTERRKLTRRFIYRHIEKYVRKKNSVGSRGTDIRDYEMLFKLQKLRTFVCHISLRIS